MFSVLPPSFSKAFKTLLTAAVKTIVMEPLMAFHAQEPEDHRHSKNVNSSRPTIPKQVDSDVYASLRLWLESQMRRREWFEN